MSSCHFRISVKTTARNIYTVPTHNKHIFVRAKRMCLFWESAYYECAYNEWAQNCEGLYATKYQKLRNSTRVKQPLTNH